MASIRGEGRTKAAAVGDDAFETYLRAWREAYRREIGEEAWGGDMVSSCSAEEAV
jgi:hypothetical protein